MDSQELITRFSSTPEDQQKGIFGALFVFANRLQTIFDNNVSEVTLKQFMLLALLRQADADLTLTSMGHLLGCSRQNVKKLALALEKKGFLKIQTSPADPRAKCLAPTEKLHAYFEEDFVQYLGELKHLFAVYTPEELATFYPLLMKLYEGIDNLEEQTANQVVKQT